MSHNNFEINHLIELNCGCHKLLKKDFLKGDTITSYIEKRKQIFIMTSR